jgi:hypothetical protein
MPVEKKTQLLSDLSKSVNMDYDTPETEVVQDPFTLDIDIVQAIRII